MQNPILFTNALIILLIFFSCTGAKESVSKSEVETTASVPQSNRNPDVEVITYRPFSEIDTSNLTLNDIIEFKEPNGAIYFREEIVKHLPNFPGEGIFEHYSYLFNISDNYEFKVFRKAENDYPAKGKFNTYFYNLYYKDYFLQRDAASFDERNGVAFEGGLMVIEIDAEVKINISVEETIQKAIKTVSEEHKIWERHDPHTQLLWLKLDNPNYQLYYKVEMLSYNEGIKKHELYINADTSIIDRYIKN